MLDIKSVGIEEAAPDEPEDEVYCEDADDYFAPVKEQETPADGQEPDEETHASDVEEDGQTAPAEEDAPEEVPAPVPEQVDRGQAGRLEDKAV
jgi:hypothetical protein